MQIVDYGSCLGEHIYIFVIVEAICLQVYFIFNLVLDAAELVLIDLIIGDKEVTHDLILLLRILAVSLN